MTRQHNERRVPLIIGVAILLVLSGLLNYVFTLGAHSHLGVTVTCILSAIPAMVISVFCMGMCPWEANGAPSMLGSFIALSIAIWIGTMAIVGVGYFPMWVVHLL
jgi:hypothetical protein